MHQEDELEEVKEKISPSKIAKVDFLTPMKS